MSDCYRYQTKKQEIRILQITDPHLFKDPQGELLGINTQASFSQVLTEVSLSHFDYDIVLATGDLVQDSSRAGYACFCQMVQALQKPVFWIPGNHDFQPKMFEILTNEQENIYPHKHLLLGEHWQILLLDSQVFGVPYGELGQYQLDWLREKLQQDPQRYTLVVLHHHILSTGSAWLDQHNLRNSHDLAYVLASFPKVKGILHGHIHQQVDDMWNGYQIMATPSTCVQFKPDSSHFALDTLQPGWRELILCSDGKIQTTVKRIEQATFLPNMLSEGY